MWRPLATWATELSLRGSLSVGGLQSHPRKQPQELVAPEPEEGLVYKLSSEI